MLLDNAAAVNMSWLPAVVVRVLADEGSRSCGRRSPQSPPGWTSAVPLNRSYGLIPCSMAGRS